MLFLLAAAAPLAAQTVCGPTPTYTPCEIVFELTPEQLKEHPNPYVSVTLQGEFRSPDHRTYLMPGFYDGGNRMVLRFSPIEPGQWDFRITSNIATINGKTGSFEAAPSGLPGFIYARNVHHWSYTENNIPHLWMGDTSYRFASIDRALFEQIVDKRAEQKFNHIRGLLIGWGELQAQAFPTPDTPNADYFREVDQRILYMNRKGIIADLILAGDQNQLAELFPTWQQRERFIRYVAARYAAMNITWQGVQEFEEYKDGRVLLKEIGELLKKFDPYRHPRSTHTVATSSPLLKDNWMDYRVYQSSDDQLGSIEHQLYGVPAVNAEFAYENSGAGASHPHHVDSDTFRRRLWNATMNGQYPTFGNTGTYGGRKFSVDAKYLDSPGAKAMTVWYDFFSKTRHWELEPYFDVDGGRCLALPGVEYIVYVEKHRPVEVLVEKHGYNIAWMDPATGERVVQKDWKGERFAAEPPSAAHDWVLIISREGRKEGMLRSYKFDSRPIALQEVEQSPEKIPFEIAQPADDALQAGVPIKFELKLKRESRATRTMMYLITGEVPGDDRGFRVLATGSTGSFEIPKSWLAKEEGIVSLRVTALNAYGKAYSLDRVYTVKK